MRPLRGVELRGQLSRQKFANTLKFKEKAEEYFKGLFYNTIWITKKETYMIFSYSYFSIFRIMK